MYNRFYEAVSERGRQEVGRRPEEAFAAEEKEAIEEWR
jgi:hypothetical protein